MMVARSEEGTVVKGRTHALDSLPHCTLRRQGPWCTYTIIINPLVPGFFGFYFPTILVNLFRFYHTSFPSFLVSILGSAGPLGLFSPHSRPYLFSPSWSPSLPWSKAKLKRPTLLEFSVFSSLTNMFPNSLDRIRFRMVMAPTRSLVCAKCHALGLDAPHNGIDSEGCDDDRCD